MGAVFEPTITLGTIVSIFVNVLVLGIPAVWWASKVTQIIKDVRTDVTELKESTITRQEIGILKESADKEHAILQKQINGVREDTRRRPK